VSLNAWVEGRADKSAEPPRAARWRGRLASLALGAVLVSGLVWLLPPWSALAERALAVSAADWALAALGLMLSYALRASRLVLEWRGRVSLRWTDGLHLTLLHSAALQVLPFRAGEAGYPLWLKHRWKVSLRDATISLLRLRLQDMAVFGLLALAAFVPLASLPWRLALVAMILAVLARWVPRWWPSLGWRSWALSAANWSVKSLALAWLLAALLGVPWVAGWQGAVGGDVAAALPVQPPAGFGLYEAGVWFGLQASEVSISAGDGLGAALTLHAFMLLLLVVCTGLSQAAQGWRDKGVSP